VDTTLLVNLTGNAAANTLTGNAGDNILNGLVGADTMVGGLGDDTYVVESLLDVVLENVGEGNDTISAAITYSLAAGISAAGTPTGSPDVENLILTGTTAINGTGNDLNNVITGNIAANTLNGGLGDDTLVGGAGNDIYVVDSLLDVINENTNEGTDTVQSSVTYILNDVNLENLTLTGTGNIDATGNIGNNVITGNSGNNVLDGGAGTGQDTLIGGLGNDTYIYNSVLTTISETSAITNNVNTSGGIDTVISSISGYTLGTNLDNLILAGIADMSGLGNALANVITGNSGANTINAGDGADTLIGGGGVDNLLGGLGNDIFKFALGDSTTAARDQILDFTRAQDKIDVSSIDANGVLAGDTAFSNVILGNTQGTLVNFSAAGQLRYYTVGTQTIVEGNTDSNFATAEFSVALQTTFATLAAGDFIL